MSGYERRQFERQYEIECQRQEEEDEREIIRFLFGPLGEPIVRVDDFVTRHPIVLVGVCAVLFAILCMMGGPDLY
jgi:hypothetical protein